MKLDILAFGAHPDDTELGCSGTLIKHVKKGLKVGVADLTLGQLGSRGSIDKRSEEALKAAEIQGLVHRENLGFEDGWFLHDKATILAIVRTIRKLQPDIVLANAVTDRHPDHGKGAKLINDACFYSGLTKIETYIDEVQQKNWRPKALYHYIQDYHIEPDFVIDITDEWDKKLEAVMAFDSQFYNPKSSEPETPISSKGFIDFLESRAITFGRPLGVRYGEGFTSSRYIGINDLTNLI